MTPQQIEEARRFLETLFSDLQPSEFIGLLALEYENGEQIGNTNRFVKDVDSALKFVEEFDSRGWDVYCSVAPLKSKNGSKEFVNPSRWVFADIDNSRIASADFRSLPPTIVVYSGGGKHVYWQLPDRTPSTVIEEINKKFFIFGGDPPAIDCSRRLRIPGTHNHKRADVADVRLLDCQPDIYYDPRDIVAFLNACACDIPVKKLVAGATTKDAVGKYLTENLLNPTVPRSRDKDKEKSRSELDWQICQLLVHPETTGSQTGCSDEFIHFLYEELPIGERKDGSDKIKRTLDKYTLPKVRQAVSDGTKKAANPFVTKDDGLYVNGEQIATFYLIAKGLYIPRDGDEEVLLCDVVSKHKREVDLPFPRKLFTSVKAINEGLRSTAYAWLGTQDFQVRKYMTHLWDQVIINQLPQRAATTVLGRHGNLWVTPDVVIGPEGPLEKGSEPLVFIKSPLPTPNVSYEFDGDVAPVILALSQYLGEINSPVVIWPAVGYFFAAPFKTVLYEQDIMFPTLMVYGQPESGKSTLIEQVMGKLAGYRKPEFQNASKITDFATGAQLSSTNGVPIILDEFKEASMSERGLEILTSLIRSQYNQSELLRGRASQHVNRYRATAPMVLVGEDVLTDPAVKDRCIIINPRKRDIYHLNRNNEPTKCYRAYEALAEFDLSLVAPHYIQFSLSYEPDFDAAMKLVKTAFPMYIGDRLRNNIAVCTVGLMAYAKFLESYGAAAPNIDVEFVRQAFTLSVREVIDVERGYIKSAVDKFASEILDAYMMQTHDFPAEFDAQANVLWFSLSGAYAYWQKTSKTRGTKVGANEEALRKQVSERTVDNPDMIQPGQYFLPAVTRRVMTPRGRVPMHAHGIDLKLAVASGITMTTEIPLAMTELIDFSREGMGIKAKTA